MTDQGSPVPVLPHRPARGGRGARHPRTWLQGLLAWGVFGLLVWLVLGLLGSSPLASAQAPQRGEDRADPARMGEALWRRDCASCHGPDGTGTAWGPDLQGKGAAAVHLAVTTGRMPIEDLSYLRDAPPGEDARQVPRGSREAREYLPGQVTALVAYARGILDGPDVPVVDVAGADVSTGSELFQLNCATCHSWSGRGGTLANGREATSLEDTTPTQVVEAMRTGLGTMPEFATGAVSDEEAADIAAYVSYLRHPRNAGGHPLNYLGPAAEGLVAGAVGLLGLLLLVRWIGSRS